MNITARRRPLPCPRCAYDLRANEWEDDGILCSECGVFSRWIEFAHLPAAKGRLLALAWGSGSYAALCFIWFLMFRIPNILPWMKWPCMAMLGVLFGPMITWWLIGPPVMADWAAQRVAPPHRANMYLLMLVAWGGNIVWVVLLAVAGIVL